MARFSLGLLTGETFDPLWPWRGGPTYALFQPREGHGDAMGPLDCELQRPEDDRSHERERWTHLIWIFPPLCLHTQARIKEGVRAEEKEEAVSWRAVTVLVLQLSTS